MLNDVVRWKAFGRIRAVLFGLKGGASVAVVVPGSPRRSRVPWPSDPAEREAAWPALLAEADAVREECELVVAPHGRPKGEWLRLVVPAPARRAGDGPRQALLGLRHFEEEAALADLAASPVDGRPEDDPPRVPKPPKASASAAPLVLATLFRAGHRLVCHKIVDGLKTAPGRGGEGFSQATVEATLSWLQSMGVVDNANDARGRGYGLTRPDRVPAWDGNDVCEERCDAG